MSATNSKLRAGVVGFTGYSGAELVGILNGHPGAEPVLVEHRPQTADEAPVFDDGTERRPLKSEGVAGLDVVFLATSPEVSIEAAPMILDAGVRVIDLSGGFRLRTQENYRRWYGTEHGQEELLNELRILAEKPRCRRLRIEDQEHVEPGQKNRDGDHHVLIFDPQRKQRA